MVNPAAVAAAACRNLRRLIMGVLLEMPHHLYRKVHKPSIHRKSGYPKLILAGVQMQSENTLL
jgi:hypothetical protein